MKKISFFTPKTLIMTLGIALVAWACQKTLDDHEKESDSHSQKWSVPSDYRSTLDDLVDKHNLALDYVNNYPDIIETSDESRADLVVSYFKMTETDSIQSASSILAILGPYESLPYDSIPAKLLDQTYINSTQAYYMDWAIDIIKDTTLTETELSDSLAILKDSIYNNESLTTNQGFVAYGFVAYVDNGMQYKNHDCGSCAKSHWKRIAAIDGLGFILGMLNPAAPVITGAVAASVGSGKALCNSCKSVCDICGRTTNPPVTGCTTCTLPFRSDGVNCHLGRAPSGSTIWMASGNFYWSDPTQSCVLTTFGGATVQGFWDGANCYYPIPPGRTGFTLDGGFYILCD